MSFLKKIFERKSNLENKPLSKVRLSEENIKTFPKYETLIIKGGLKFDSKGRLRYLHGAPVGDLILIRVNKDNNPTYKESAEEWFDAESQKAKEFVWE